MISRQPVLNTAHTAKIRDTDSALIVAQLLFLEAEETSKPIHVYINSPGGSVTAGLAIYDTVSLPDQAKRRATLTNLGVDAICFIADTHVLRWTSMLHGLSPPRGRRER